LTLCAFALSGGVGVWERFPGGRRWLRVAMAAPMLALLIGALALVHGVAAKATALTTGPVDLAARLSALAGPPGARVRLFFARYAEDLDFLEATAVYPRASHVLLASELYRFVSHGLYPMKMFSPSILGPGDVFGAAYGDLPPYPDHWTRVRAGGHVLWVYDR